MAKPLPLFFKGVFVLVAHQTWVVILLGRGVREQRSYVKNEEIFSTGGKKSSSL